MLHNLLLFLALQPASLAALLCIHRVLPMKHPVPYCVLSLGTMDLFWLLNRFILPRPWFFLNILIICSSFCYLPLFADRGRRLISLFIHAMITTLMLMTANIMGRILGTAGPWLGVAPGRFQDMRDPLYILSLLVDDLVLVPVLLLFSDTLRKLLRSVEEDRYLLWFLTVPFSQITLLLMVPLQVSPEGNIRTWITILAGFLLCLAADWGCILGCRKLHELEEMTARVRQAEQQLNIQNESFREMQDNILRVNKIRHDLNNQLTAAYYLLEQGHPEEVRRQLDTLSSCVQDHIGTRYCEHLMVDTVLREKAALCSRSGIPLELSAFVPADLNLDSAHLCSAFSNLLDNSVAAALRAGPDSGPIRLRCDIRKGYLVIACSNPSYPPSQERRRDILRRHGLGLEILGSLARIHSGCFQTEYKDGRFYVNMTLKIEKNTPAET